jgi:hypothetical protein
MKEESARFGAHVSAEHEGDDEAIRIVWETECRAAGGTPAGAPTWRVVAPGLLLAEGPARKPLTQPACELQQPGARAELREAWDDRAAILVRQTY